MSLAKTYYTAEQYLSLERVTEHKSELINGEIYAMSGASRAHNLIATNVLGAVHSQFRGKPCEVYSSDMRVKVSPTGMYTYPDVVAVCGKPEFEDVQVDTLLNPTVIIEVLSPSTEAYDRGVKFGQYRKLQSLTDYVLISQDRMLVEHFARQSVESGQWLLTAISDPGAVLYLTSIGCYLSVTDIYEKLDLPETVDEPMVEEGQ